MVHIGISGTQQYASLAASSSQSETWTKVKTLTMTSSYTGSWSISFLAYSDGYYGSGECQIRKNGTIVLTSGAAYDEGLKNVGFSNIAISSGDTIEAWLIRNPDSHGEGFSVFVESFAVSFSLAGYASFTSTPSVAQIWVDGGNTSINTPATIQALVVGSHNYTLKKSGYADISGSFSVTSQITTNVPLVTFLASASFTSSPTTARIWIDSVDKGINTPGTITGVTAGTRNYTLKKATYLDTSGTFVATAGTTTTVPLVTLPPSATTSVIIID